MASNFGDFGRFAASYNVTIEKELGRDLYITFKGQWSGQAETPVVVKFFFAESDANNEFEILQFLYGAKLDVRVPRPFLKVVVPMDNFKYNGRTYEDVWLMVVYEFLEGEPLKRQSAASEKRLGCREDIAKHLKALHDLGLVFAGLRADNILKTPSGKCVLVDYGRAFSASRKPFPPMRYMLEDETHGEGLPTQAEDFEKLNVLCDG